MSFPADILRADNGAGTKLRPRRRKLAVRPQPTAMVMKWLALACLWCAHQATPLCCQSSHFVLTYKLVADLGSGVELRVLKSTKVGAGERAPLVTVRTRRL